MRLPSKYLAAIATRATGATKGYLSIAMRPLLVLACQDVACAAEYYPWFLFDFDILEGMGPRSARTR